MTTTALSRSTKAPAAGAPVRWSLWIAQGLIAMIYLWAASMKLTKAPAELAGMIPWAADYSVTFLRGIGLIDLAGGLGILLPALTRVMPRLTVVAAISIVVHQLCAVAFHVSRGEFAVLPFNVVLIALSLWVAWGRSRKAPISARSAG